MAKSTRSFRRGDPGFSGRIRDLARYLYVRFLRIRGTPEDIAWGMAIGLFIGMTPTVGLQTYIAVLIALLLRKSKIAAAMGVWVTNPVTIPFFFGLTYFLGARIWGYPLKQRLLMSFSFEGLQTTGKHVLISLWTGGIAVGLIAAILGYVLTLQIVIRGKKKTQKLRRKIKLSGRATASGSFPYALPPSEGRTQISARGHSTPSRDEARIAPTTHAEK